MNTKKKGNQKLTKKELTKTEETQTLPSVNTNAGLSNALKVAEELSKSDIIPKEFQKKPANCLIAIQLANRLKTDPFMVMQNSNVIYGKPSFSSSFIIACINGSGKLLGSLKFELNEKETKCRAWGIEKETGSKLYGPTITMEMAQAEGWVSKNGSKWKTMPGLMLRYRAASFFGRLQCPEILNGIYSTEEMEDMQTISAGDVVDVFAEPDTLPDEPTKETTEPEMEITPEMEEAANDYFEQQELL